MMSRQNLEWQVGHSTWREEQPREWVAAEVPGAVQIDWGRARGLDPVLSPNPADYVWMEDATWTYRAVTPIPATKPGERLWFVSKGIDYGFAVRLDGKELHRQEGMFTPVRVELTGLVREGSLLEVVVDPAPKSSPDHKNRTEDTREQANQSCKPAMNYGWDFAPHLIPLGICDDTWLEVTAPGSIFAAECLTSVGSDLAQGTAECKVALEPADGASAVWTLAGPDGREVARESAPASGEEWLFQTTVASPELWWPRGQGAQALYTARLEIVAASGKILDSWQQSVGFRRIRLVENADGDRYNEGAPPITRRLPPMTLEVNGRRIFAKGSNWVAPNLYHGAVRPEHYAPLLDVFESANMNTLRMWGGSAVAKDAFFEECDRRGILVWQEFPLACNRYEGTPEYLRVLDQESKSIVRRLRSHPCLALWCGGNELFNSWSGMNEQDAAIRLLNRNCFDLDRERPFLSTSPLMGVGHGDYLFNDRRGREPHQIYRQARCSAYCEFGVGSAASVDVLKKIIPEAELFPPKHGGAWTMRNGLDSWGGPGWLCRHIPEKYFGESASVEELAGRSHVLAGEGLKFIFEEARRQKPATSMALSWCFNEPWTTAANGSLVSWPCSPKPHLVEVGNACRPSLASARVSKFCWKPSETFEAELWLLNDAPSPIPAGRAEAWLVSSSGELHVLGWDHPEVPANENLAGPTARVRLPERWNGIFELQLRTPAAPSLASTYRFVAKS
jgi:beta-mannosidase